MYPARTIDVVAIGGGQAGLAMSDRCQIISRLASRTGRKISTEAAIVGSNRCNGVIAGSTWFVIDRTVGS